MHQQQLANELNQVSQVHLHQAPHYSNSMAVASLVLGILALMVCWIPFLGLLGTLLGVLGLVFVGAAVFLALFRRRQVCARIGATPMTTQNIAGMKALSIRQPHAEAIMRGTKTSEYRSGPTKNRGRILIYASLGRDDREYEDKMMIQYRITDIICDDLARGVLIGSVELHDCDGGKWFLRQP